MTYPLLAIYADESCLGNGKSGDNPGGAAGVIEWKHPKTEVIKRWDYWTSEPSTTNNRMALRSVIEAFNGISKKNTPFHVVFISDSKYIVDGMTAWVHGWAARGWTRKGGAIENLELWKDALRSLRHHVVEWKWVKGHAGHPQNEYANHLAISAATNLSSSGGLIDSKFEEWCESQKNRAVLAQTLASFPTAEEFKGKHRNWKL